MVAMLALTAIAVSLPALLLYVYSGRVRQEARAISYLEVEDRARYVELDALAIVDRNTLEVLVLNRGGREVRIEGFFAMSTCDDRRSLLRLGGSREVVRPGSTYHLATDLADVGCSRLTVDGVYVVTSEPRVYAAKLYNLTVIEELGAPTGGLGAPVSVNYVLIPVELRADPWDLAGVLKNAGFMLAVPDSNISPSRLDILDHYGVLETGMVSSSGQWTLSNVFNSVVVGASDVPARNLFLGYDPRDPSKYVLLITTDSSITLTVNGAQTSFCLGAAATRVKIYGFVSGDSRGVVYVRGDAGRFGSGMWVRSPDQDVASYTFLGREDRGRVSLVGRADRVEVYCYQVGVTGASGYYPYLLFMNAVSGRSGRTGLLFTAIDVVYGRSTTRNDLTRTSAGTWIALQDTSRIPLVLVYGALAIDNNNTKAVLISLNYRFHDNEGEDFGGVTEDRPVVILGLVCENGTVLSYRSFTFRELTRYEDTYPPTAQAQSALALIPLPPRDSAGPLRFYVFLMIQDPYLYNTSNNNLDDLDLTLYIESLAIVLFE